MLVKSNAKRYTVLSANRWSNTIYPGIKGNSSDFIPLDKTNLLLISDKSLFISEFYIGLGGDMVCPPHHYFKKPLDNFNILFYTIGEK